MGLFSKLKGKDKQQDYSHLQGSSSSPYTQPPPPEDYSHLSSENKGKGKQHTEYAPPPPLGPPSGAPPGYDYEPPPGPPPAGQYNYPPPSGLPPSFDEIGGSSGAPTYNTYGPPPGPPPGYMLGFPEPNRPEELPPVRSQEYSQGLNATEDQAEAGHDYCRRYPVYPPAQFPPETVDLIHRGEVGLFQPSNFDGHLEKITKTTYKVHTHKKTQDATLLSGLPLYSYVHDAPKEKAYKTVYYEIKIRDLGKHDGEETSLAIGFVNVPTPPFRLPGWHRGGLAIHSDDGNRYINDSYGGRKFTKPFKEGETIGLGIRFRMGMAQAFFTRDGKEVGSWMVDETIDSDDYNRTDMGAGAKGLLGDNDLYAAIGVFGKAEFDVEFGYSEWQDSTINF
ncbi:hypothetical protein ABW19_dt0200644 [Dactylella cylindrospora]|nr:hypothetical protein ABW19_dt0200644 [Dactylella cylindrospora]